MLPDLFPETAGRREALAAEAHVLRGFVLAEAALLLEAIGAIDADAPFRRMQTRGGFTMSVAMTNCGDAGWTTDRDGYRYTARDPLTGRPWPAMPDAIRAVARAAAAEAGFPAFEPDACLVNRYEPGARMSLHQDRDEHDLEAPIVSLSLGLPATFLFGGFTRGAPTRRVRLEHGDAVVWGGEDRLRFHGVAPLRSGHHPLLGARRFNLTLRKAR